ncbi:hypothetical protein [Capnocytophaga sp. G2]|uniref:hypothetical protein n=1 Tax=Capnocytophaga sp. G2 TaxID=3110695 RepID=UPI002B4A687F|nr:hypothetical protein [Capnocytophaga sp. G2]MEB3005771.1 hypothetical protein [Capnocytophaga sp. G2]
MRKYIIKLFALSYIVSFGGKTRSFTRSANIIFPLMLVGGLIVCAELYSWLCVLLPLLALACFFSFGYFHFFPLTNKDFSLLDNSQRWQYEVLHSPVISEPKSYNVRWVLWVNPIATVITLILLFTLIL